MLKSPTILDFAVISAAAYNIPDSTVNGFSRYGDARRGVTGFQGASYCRNNVGGGLDIVVAYAGTQPGQDAEIDAVTDIGFGGAASLVMPFPIPGFVGAASIAGFGLLRAQLDDAKKLAETAHYGITSARSSGNDRLYLTGHSLGGGLAQIVAADTGFSAFAISAPAVSHLWGVESDLKRTKANVVCLKVQNDPINHTLMFGRLLGRIENLFTSRTGLAAHSIDQTALELSPSGATTVLGQKEPLA